MTMPIVMQGKLTSVPVNAIVTLINPAKVWTDRIDQEIRKIAGSQFHMVPEFLLGQSGLADKQVVVAKGKGSHPGEFENVVFVVDESVSMLHELVFAALMEAKNQQYTSIAIPLLRAGIMRDRVEKTTAATIAQTLLAIKTFQDRTQSRMQIHIVIDNNHRAYAHFCEAVKQRWPK